MPMETRYTRAEKNVGVFVVAITILLLATVVMLGRGKDWFAEEVTFYTQFKESYNLEANAAVKLFKADIGKVKRINLREDHVEVELRILHRYASRIRKGSVASVDSPTLIGSEYISILPGSTHAAKIPPGGAIPSVEKRSISDMLKAFEVEKTAQMTVKMIQETAALIETLKSPDGPLLNTLNNIQQTSLHLARITGHIENGQGSLGSLVVSRELVDGVMQNLATVNRLLVEIRDTSTQGPGIMAQVSGNLTTIQNAGSGVVASVEKLKVILLEAQGALQTIHQILDNFRQASEEVPRVTTTAKDGIREIREGVQNIDRVVKSLQRNIIIRSNLPDEPTSLDTDAGIRP